MFSGGIADSVSKWVFRHSLAPERLKEILEMREDSESRQEEPEKCVSKSQDDKDRTAGQKDVLILDFNFISHTLHIRHF